MNSSKNSSEILRELELTKKKDMVLEALYTAGKITQSTYEYIKRDLTKTLMDLEARVKILTSEDEAPLIQLELEDKSNYGNDYHVITEGAIQSIQSPKVDSNTSCKVLNDSEMDEEQVKLKKDTCVSEATLSRTEKQNMKGASWKEDRPERGFHFYEGLGKPTGQIALSLEDFAEKVSKIPLVSLEFHQERGDFANWIRETFNDYPLAENIGKINEQGENLRTKIIEMLSLEQQYILPCPDCGKALTPQKTWKMVGKPNKAGKSFQLTLGYYKCPDCEKSFRDVLGKEVI